MKVIQHQPWVGNTFSKRTARLLVLGESHHGEDPDAVNMTVPVVEEWLSGVSNAAYRFFTHLAVALSGQEPRDIDRNKVFSPIAFYNYVGRVLAGPRISPSKNDFNQSEPAFRQVLERIRPTHIAVCGTRLWDNMPAFDPPISGGSRIMLGDKDFLLGSYRAENATALAMCIRHPQSGFNGREWYPRMQAFLSVSL